MSCTITYVQPPTSEVGPSEPNRERSPPQEALISSLCHRVVPTYSDSPPSLSSKETSYLSKTTSHLTSKVSSFFSSISSTLHNAQKSMNFTAQDWCIHHCYTASTIDTYLSNTEHSDAFAVSLMQRALYLAKISSQDRSGISLELDYELRSIGHVTAATQNSIRGVLAYHGARFFPADTKRAFSFFDTVSSLIGKTYKARCLWEGEACERDIPQAIHLLEEACAQDSTLAITTLRSLYHEAREGLSPEELFLIHEVCVSHDFSEAYNELALCYHYGKGVAVDKERALALFQEGAERKDPEAAYNYALLSLASEAPHDKVCMSQHLYEAAQAGKKEALFMLSRTDTEAYMRYRKSTKKYLEVEHDIETLLSFAFAPFAERHSFIYLLSKNADAFESLFGQTSEDLNPIHNLRRLCQDPSFRSSILSKLLVPFTTLILHNPSFHSAVKKVLNDDEVIDHLYKSLVSLGAEGFLEKALSPTAIATFLQKTSTIPALRTLFTEEITGVSGEDVLIKALKHEPLRRAVRDKAVKPLKAILERLRGDPKDTKASLLSFLRHCKKIKGTLKEHEGTTLLEAAAPFLALPEIQEALLPVLESLSPDNLFSSYILPGKTLEEGLTLFFSSEKARKYIRDVTTSPIAQRFISQRSMRRVCSHTIGALTSFAQNHSAASLLDIFQEKIQGNALISRCKTMTFGELSALPMRYPPVHAALLSVLKNKSIRSACKYLIGSMTADLFIRNAMQDAVHATPIPALYNSKAQELLRKKVDNAPILSALERECGTTSVRSTLSQGFDKALAEQQRHMLADKEIPYRDIVTTLSSYLEKDYQTVTPKLLHVAVEGLNLSAAKIALLKQDLSWDTSRHQDDRTPLVKAVLGLIYTYGGGDIAADGPRGRSLLRESTEDASTAPALGYYSLALCHRAEKDYAAMLSAYAEAGKRGSMLAKYSLGRYHLKAPDDEKQHHDAAESYFFDALALGHPKARKHFEKVYAEDSAGFSSLLSIIEALSRSSSGNHLIRSLLSEHPSIYSFIQTMLSSLYDTAKEGLLSVTFSSPTFSTLQIISALKKAQQEKSVITPPFISSCLDLLHMPSKKKADLKKNISHYMDTDGITSSLLRRLIVLFEKNMTESVEIPKEDNPTKEKALNIIDDVLEELNLGEIGSRYKHLLEYHLACAIGLFHEDTGTISYWKYGPLLIPLAVKTLFKYGPLLKKKACSPLSYLTARLCDDGSLFRDDYNPRGELLSSLWEKGLSPLLKDHIAGIPPKILAEDMMKLLPSDRKTLKSFCTTAWQQVQEIHEKTTTITTCEEKPDLTGSDPMSRESLKAIEEMLFVSMENLKGAV
jgi:TPR repeat protein